MKLYRATYIEWDTDGEEVDLPVTADFQLEDDEDPEFYGADALTDEYGWCIISFSFEEITH